MWRAIFIVLGTVACSTRVHTGAMTSTPFAAPDEAVQLSLHESFVVAGVAGRGLFGPDQGMAALGLEALMPPGILGPNKQPLSPHFALGVHALQLDWSSGTRTFGAGSPYAQIGGHACRNRKYPPITCVGVSLDMAYHLRFGADDQLWTGASLVLSRFDDPTSHRASTRRRGGTKKRRRKGKKRRR